MFESNIKWIDGVCDLCGYPKIWGLAEKLVEPNVMVNGSWVDGHTVEKSQKWGKAIKKAGEQLTVRCLYLDTSEDGGSICKKCILDYLEQENS